MRILLIAAALVSTATAGELNHPNSQARQTYDQVKAQQAALREFERQRDAEMKRRCETEKTRKGRTMMNTPDPRFCAPYWGE